MISKVAPALRRHALSPALKITVADLNQASIQAKYAVRGRIPILADELKSSLDTNPKTHGLPFDKIIAANIGNPQQLDQKPLTWYRLVLSVLQNPDLLDKGIYPKDVEHRARTLLNAIGSVGAYLHSQGDLAVRRSVANFITKRDGYPANAKNIFLTGGASAAVSYLIDVLSLGLDAGFLIPIPQYPLYTATIALNNAVPIGYYLNEENNWLTDPKQIRQLIKESADKGVKVKALVVINPGNPTGSILRHQDLVELIDIAAEHGIVLIADEVYQENVFSGEFVLAKQVLAELLEADPNRYTNVQLALLHLTSKGVSGECGQRGGYMELVGFHKEVTDVIFKLASINLCSVVTGQALVELMVNPPAKGDPSHELYAAETGKIHALLRERSLLLYEAFSAMEDVTCNRPQGAMYLFPRLHFSQERYPEVYARAQELEMEVDEFYCAELLKHTGICCVPGSGFGQVPGTLHLRTTFLPPGTEWSQQWARFHADFVAKYKQ